MGWTPGKEQNKRLTRTIAAVAIIASLILLASWIWRAPHMPNELLGEWHTTDPNYADRWFEIDPVCISFVTGRGGVSTGFIKAMQGVPEGSRILYRISYSVDGTLNEVAFYYEAAHDPVIRFKNQEKIIWIKDKSG